MPSGSDCSISITGKHREHWWHYQQEGGLPALRQAICTYLQLSRSVRCQPDQILVVQGAQQALELTARLADPADQAWMEEPGYVGAQAALQAAGLHIIPVPVDNEGLNPAAAPPTAATADVHYAITPISQWGSHVACAAWSCCNGQADNSWIIEDDYDSEFRYDAQPIASLQGLADSARVIYLGTFSKVMFPAMRLAYLVIPPALIDAFRAAYARLYREGSYAQQAALADFIEQGILPATSAACATVPYTPATAAQRYSRPWEPFPSPPARPACIWWQACQLISATSSSASKPAEQAAPAVSPLPGAQQRNGLVLGYAGVEENAFASQPRDWPNW
jgi:GntR family transcriptional regulator/MocR family aminotransferase